MRSLLRGSTEGVEEDFGELSGDVVAFKMGRRREVSKASRFTLFVS